MMEYAANEQTKQSMAQSILDQKNQMLFQKGFQGRRRSLELLKSDGSLFDSSAADMAF